jgi:hypothetical protein
MAFVYARVCARIILISGTLESGEKKGQPGSCDMHAMEGKLHLRGAVYRWKTAWNLLAFFAGLLAII